MLSATLPRQGSLFHEAGAGLEGGSAERVHLDTCCWFDLHRGWYADPDHLFDDLLATLDWHETERWMYDRMVRDPRLGASVQHHPARLRASRLQLEQSYGVDFGAIWCNLYRDGRDSVAWHGDRIDRSRPVDHVAVLSLGGTRTFRIRPTGGGNGRSYLLHSGDLLVMGGRMQSHFEHAVPKRASAYPRISVTFRAKGAGNADRRGRRPA